MSDDVGHAFLWLGEAWARALTGGSWFAPASGSLRVHRGGLVCPNRWGRLVCFAGVGPGEVVAGDGDDAKVVGMSQRRTRSGALFQCAVPLAWDPRSLVELLALSDDDRERAGADLSGAVVAVARATTPELVASLVSELPS